MLDSIIKKVEAINKRTYEVSKFDSYGLKGKIFLNEGEESSGVILFSDGREVSFHTSPSGQLLASHEGNQKIVSSLRTKILDLMELKDQRDTLFREFILQSEHFSCKDHVHII